MTTGSRLTLVIIVCITAMVLGPLGCKPKPPEPPQPIEPEAVKIGAILPLTGDAAKYGKACQKGIDLAVEEINETATAQGHLIEVVYEDSQATPKLAVSAFEKLVTRDRVPAIIGPLASSAALAVAPKANAREVVILSPGASTPELTGAGEYVFRNEVSDEYGARRSAELFFNHGFADVGMLYVNNDFGVGWKTVVSETYAKLGGQVRIAEAFDQDATDFRTQLAKIGSAKTLDALLLVTYEEAIPILRQMRELGIDVPILSTPLFEDEEIVKKVGDLAEGVLYTYYGTFSAAASEINERVKEFASKFHRAYGAEEEIAYYVPIAYDAAHLLGKAMEAGTDGPSIKRGLHGIKDFPAVTGPTSFDENGDVMKPIILKTVKGGAFIQIEERASEGSS